MKADESLDSELLQKAYDALCKKFNLKRIYVTFFARCNGSRMKYRCSPHLKALSNDDCYLDFCTDNNRYAYVNTAKSLFQRAR